MDDLLSRGLIVDAETKVAFGKAALRSRVTELGSMFLNFIRAPGVSNEGTDRVDVDAPADNALQS